MTDDSLNFDEGEVVDDISKKHEGVAKFTHILLTTTCVIHDYYALYVHKSPCMTSSQSGDKWVCELLHGHPTRFHNIFRMSQCIFVDILFLLESSYGLHGSRRTTSREVLAITLYILGHNESIRSTCERFQHSTETISRLFYNGLQALVRLGMEIIAPVDKLFHDIPAQILNDARYMPYFKDCIGAIDGTHVDARIPVEEHVAYIGRHHSPTQNVMAACDFNMCFTFVAPGWEGSAHDARIFQHAVTDPKYNFPKPPPGKFYLVDAGYPLQRGYLKPYLGTRYHIPDFRRGCRQLRGHKEVFNSIHSSLRSVIERSFGVWKKKWGILRDMPNYSFNKQRLIVVGTMTLHNYIRRHVSRHDPEFEECDCDENFVHPEAYQYRIGEQVEEITTLEAEVDLTGVEGVHEMVELRDRIAFELCNCNRNV